MQRPQQTAIHFSLISLSKLLDCPRVESPGPREGLLDAEFVAPAVVKSSVDLSRLAATQPIVANAEKRERNTVNFCASNAVGQPLFRPPPNNFPLLLHP